MVGHFWVYYQFYGLAVAADRALGALAECDGPREPDVVCRFGHLPAWLDVCNLEREKPIFCSRVLDSRGVPLVRVWRHSASGAHCFQYSEGLTFVINRRGSQVWAQRAEGASAELETEYLLGGVLAFVMHLHGYICFHASAVAIDGRAILFAGDHGRGKSSTAAALSERGFPVLTDDVSPVRRDAGGQIVVMPGVPRICLWPDSVGFLYGPGAARRLPEFLPGEDKRVVRLDRSGDRRPPAATPLGAVYLLAARSDDPAAPTIEPLDLVGSLLQLAINAFVSSVLDSESREREFSLQAEVARSVPLRRLVPSSDLRKLGRLCDLVVDDVRAAAAPVGQAG